MSVESPSRFRLSDFIVVVVVAVLLGALVTPAILAAREASRRLQCENNLKTLSLGVQNYTDTWGRFPPGTVGSRELLPPQRFSWSLPLVTSAGEAIAHSISLQMMASILIPMLFVATCSIAFGRMNALWSRRIRSAIYAGAVPTMKRGFSLRELLLAVSVIAAMTAITSQLIRSAPPWHAENIYASAAPFSLPPGATDVSYCKGHRGTIAYEFNTDESAFRKSVDSGIGSIESESAGIQLREINSPFTIRHYFAYSSDLNGPDQISVNSGLYYSWSKEDRGVHAAYDRTIGRAYYHAHFH